MRGIAPPKSRIDLPSRRVFEYNKIGRKTVAILIICWLGGAPPLANGVYVGWGVPRFSLLFYKTGPRDLRNVKLSSSGPPKRETVVKWTSETWNSRQVDVGSVKQSSLLRPGTSEVWNSRQKIGRAGETIKSD